jgi:hypothetical protein
MERCSPLSIVGCCLSDFSGSSCGGALAPWLANIFVNAPGSDCAAGAPGLASEACEKGGGAPGLDSETWEGPEAGLDNIFVNSPGADFGAAGEGGAAETDAFDDGA